MLLLQLLLCRHLHYAEHPIQSLVNSVFRQSFVLYKINFMSDLWFWFDTSWSHVVWLRDVAVKIRSLRQFALAMQRVDVKGKLRDRHSVCFCTFYIVYGLQRLISSSYVQTIYRASSKYGKGNYNYWHSVINARSATQKMLFGPENLLSRWRHLKC